MIPIFEDIAVDEDDEEVIDEEVQPGLTYLMDPETKTITGTMIDHEEAIRQMISTVLRIERMEYEIYDEDFGSELSDMIGEPIPLIYADIEEDIRDTLLEDDRVTDVTDFEFEQIDRSTVHVDFVVETDYGDIEYEEEVTING